MNAFQYATALSPNSARHLAGDHGAYIAGGNDLLGLLKDYLADPDILVNIKSLPGLDSIQQGQDKWTLGALVKIAELENSAELQNAFPGIHDAASMPQPEMSDRVSVGVFADQAHAVKRAEQVRALGFKPTLGLRQRTVPAHWLDFELKSGDSDPQPVELIGTPIRPGLGLGPVKLADCPAESGNG